MALTANFKKFVVIVALIAVPAIFYVVGKDKNYWGLLDKKPEPIQAVQEAPAPVPTPQPYAQQPAQQAADLPQPLPFETKSQPAPQQQTQPDATINKMKGLDKL